MKNKITIFIGTALIIMFYGVMTLVKLDQVMDKLKEIESKISHLEGEGE